MTDPSLALGADDTFRIDRNTTDTNMYFFTSSSARMTIETGGNIGIGITSPTELLDVSGNLNLITASSFKIAGTDVLTGITLGSGVVNSSLTSLGTLSSLLMGGNIDMGTNNITNATSIVTTGITGAIQTPAQTNITSLGTLSSLLISGDLVVDTNTLYVDSGNNFVGIGTTGPAVSLDIQTTDAIQVPVGTDAQRPTGVTGMFRFNGDSVSFEGYAGTTWAAIGGGGGGSLWTENGADIYFDTGDVGIGHSINPTELLDVRDAATATAGVGARLGEGFVGAWSANNGFASFAHTSNSNSTTDYAMIQSAAGQTFINSASGLAISFRVNNSDVGSFDTNSNFVAVNEIQTGVCQTVGSLGYVLLDEQSSAGLSNSDYTAFQFDLDNQSTDSFAFYRFIYRGTLDSSSATNPTIRLRYFDTGGEMATASGHHHSVSDFAGTSIFSGSENFSAIACWNGGASSELTYTGAITITLSTTAREVQHIGSVSIMSGASGIGIHIGGGLTTSETVATRITGFGLIAVQAVDESSLFGRVYRML